MMRGFSIAACTLAVIALLPTGCESNTDTPLVSATGGSPERGRQAIARYGCASCHTIPGIRGATALVGPPLDHMAARSYIGGVIENRPENMLRWLQNPRAVDPRTAMPDLHLPERDARDIASYLYTLQ